MKEFLICSKIEFIRSILSRRQTPEIAHLVVCVLIDNEITDPQLISRVAQQLLQLKMFNPLLGLLKYARRSSVEAHSIPNLPTYYARVFEWVFNKIDYQTEESASEIVPLIYFLLG